MKSQNVISILADIWGNDYQYLYLPANRKEKVKAICKQHGVFEKPLGEHLRGSGCPSCSRVNAGKINKIKRKIPSNVFFEECSNVHNNKYSYEGVEYVHSLKKLSLNCEDHGPFEVRSDRHKRGQGCQVCSYQRSAKRKTLTFECWKQRCVENHMINYDYSRVKYEGTWLKVTIGCPDHGWFEQEASHHMRGADCPRCRGRRSKICEQWLDSLGVNNREVYIKSLRRWADGFDEISNTVYLFHEDYWQGNPDVFASDEVNPTTGKTYGALYANTMAGEHAYREAGFTVVSIWENDYVTSRSTLFDHLPC